MKKLLIVTVLVLISTLSYSQEKEEKVILLDSKRKIILLDLKISELKEEIKKAFEKTKDSTFYIQHKVDGKWWECKMKKKSKTEMFYQEDFI